jgi:predicted porin
MEMIRISGTLVAIGAAALLSGPARAGSLAEPVVVAPPAPPVPAYSGGDWTGFYLGGQVGRLDVDGEGALNGVGGDDTTYGLHAGYNYDFGRWVLGGELDYDDASVDLEAAGAAIGESVDSVWRAKLRGGYDFGRTLLYATIGAADVDTTVGGDTGEFYGLGVSFKASERVIISGEYLQHNFSDIGGNAGFDADADTFTIRASFQF